MHKDCRQIEMMQSFPSYSVAIRTLGTAGDKYVSELKSIRSQTLRPDGIFVYIPDGYEVEPVADEVYVRCDKGMVHQRSLPFDEIKSEYILFLDDDVFLPDDAVEKLFAALSQSGADCIAPVFYENHRLSWEKKVKIAFFAGTYPDHGTSWAFRVRRDAHYSYCNAPMEVMPSQSASFACFLCRKDAYADIHFEDERWIDTYGYALGDDQLFFYKLHLYGHKLAVHYNTGIIHLDARTSKVIDRKRMDYVSRLIRYVIWYRTIWQVDVTFSGRMKSAVALAADALRSLAACLCNLFMGRTYALPNMFRAFKDGYAFVKSKDYRDIPPFMAHKKN